MEKPMRKHKNKEKEAMEKDELEIRIRKEIFNLYQKIVSFKKEVIPLHEVVQLIRNEMTKTEEERIEEEKQSYISVRELLNLINNKIKKRRFIKDINLRIDDIETLLSIYFNRPIVPIEVLGIIKETLKENRKKRIKRLIRKNLL
jgi:hypothetical protein